MKTDSRQHRAGDTIFVIDDDPEWLKAITRWLRALDYEVAAFSTAGDFLGALPADATGCVIADLRMPGLNGLELQATLARGANPLPVIFLTGEGDIPSSVKAMRLGAEDFLMKTAPKAELEAALGRALSRAQRERSERARQRELRALFSRLSPREREVLELVLSGKPNKQIADALQIHERTVKLHRTNLTRRLKVASVAELARLAGELGIPARPAGPGLSR